MKILRRSRLPSFFEGTMKKPIFNLSMVCKMIASLSVIFGVVFDYFPKCVYFTPASAPALRQGWLHVLKTEVPKWLRKWLSFQLNELSWQLFVRLFPNLPWSSCLRGHKKVTGNEESRPDHRFLASSRGRYRRSIERFPHFSHVRARSPAERDSRSGARCYTGSPRRKEIWPVVARKVQGLHTHF